MARSRNYIFNPKQFYCACVKRQQSKITSGQNLIPNISRYMRISQIINTSLGGNINFGNDYLGQQPRIDALGSIEGQPGGSFSPVRNKF
jgi:hypothetical protein